MPDIQKLLRLCGAPAAAYRTAWKDGIDIEEPALWIEDFCRRYGAAREAAGYIKGVKAENKRCKRILIEKMKHYDGFPDRALAAQCFDHAQNLLGGCAYDVALRGEMKP